MTGIIFLATALLAAPPDAPLRGFHEYQHEAREALRYEATAPSLERRAAALGALVAIYAEISSDPRWETSDTLKQLRIKLRSRLIASQRELERQIAKEAKPYPGTTQAAAATDSYSAYEAQSWEDLQPDLAGVEAALGGGAMIGDWGPALVNLIQRTIAADKWDTVGGPFTIVYYAPLKVLVVRATGDVHEKVGGGLGALRAAGP
jgi:hypothetical protein